MKRRTMFAAFAAAGIVAGLSQTASARDLIYGSYLPPKHNVNTYGLEPLFKELGPDIPWKLVSGGQLFSGKVTLKSVGYGAADAGVVIPAYVQSELKNAFTSMDMMTLAADPLAMNAAVMDAFVNDCPQCLADYEKTGTVLLATYAVGEWSLLCRDEVKSLDDIKGKRVRTTGALGRWAVAMGATPVSMTSGDMIEAIARGQLDCIFGSFAWLKAYPIEDSIKSIYAIRRGATTVNLFVMNRDSWKDLGAEKQKQMLKHMPATIARTMVDGYMGDDLKAQELAKKMNISVVKPENKAYQIYKEFQARDADVIIEAAKKRGAKNPEQIVNSILKRYDEWEKKLAGLDRSNLEKLSEGYAKALWDGIYSKIDPAKL